MHDYRVNDRRERLGELSEKGITRGNENGFRDVNFTVKEGCTTYIVGAPHCGKTEFWLSVLMNLSIMYGWKHLIFTPETGDVDEIIAELSHKFIGKPYYKDTEYGLPMSDAERNKAYNFLDKHFIIIDPQSESLTVDDFYESVPRLEKKYGMMFNTTLVDPFNEFKHSYAGKPRDVYIEDTLSLIRRDARATGRHHCVITHCRDQVPVTKDGYTYFPPPTARDYANGQAWFRKGLLMLCVWRPPFGMDNGFGHMYERNECQIIVQKSKPKGVSKNGVYTVYYDPAKSCYYEKDHSGKRIDNDLPDLTTTQDEFIF